MVRTPSDSDKEATESWPDDRLERRAKRNGARLVVGLDEVGRGPLAGPVVVAAVCFTRRNYPEGINDSKKLTPAERERLYERILAVAEVSVAVAGAARVDRMNILRASLWGMARAASSLSVKPDFALIDGRDIPPGLPCECKAVIGGDAISVSIAAASIVAKVVRDRMMTTLGLSFPQYGFAEHKGYSTPVHLAALFAHGPCPHHRRSFAPVRASLGLDVTPDLFAAPDLLTAEVA